PWFSPKELHDTEMARRPHRARANSSWITLPKLSSDWTPTSSRPLIKKVGVPVTPTTRVPSSTSCCTAVWYVPLLRHGSIDIHPSPFSFLTSDHQSEEAATRAGN